MTVVDKEILQPPELSIEANEAMVGLSRLEADVDRFIGLLYQQPEHRLQHVQIGLHARRLMEMEGDENTERWRSVARNVFKVTKVVTIEKSAPNKSSPDTYQLHPDLLDEETLRKLNDTAVTEN